jgi:hypothetical protein
MGVIAQLKTKGVRTVEQGQSVFVYAVAVAKKFRIR